jgi:hypothetical protein
MLQVLSTNRALQDIHRGARCFILGTGPSINKQDLRPLRSEICISMNSFFLHKDYPTIAPQYHIASGLALHPLIPLEVGVQWYREMEEKTGSATMLLNLLDHDTIQKYNLFRNHTVFFLDYRGEWNALQTVGIDAAKLLYPGQSVSIMAIQVAIYMGFKEIYLLGLDHDWILRLAERLPTHFYNPEESILEGSAEANWIGTNWKNELWCNWNLWDQYEKLKAFAEMKGVIIFNATAGGLLDVFEKVDYDQVVRT